MLIDSCWQVVAAVSVVPGEVRNRSTAAAAGVDDGYDSDCVDAGQLVDCPATTLDDDYYPLLPPQTLFFFDRLSL